MLEPKATVNAAVVDDDPSTALCCGSRLQLDERTERARRGRQRPAGRRDGRVAPAGRRHPRRRDAGRVRAGRAPADPRRRAERRIIIFAGTTNTVSVAAADAVFVKSGDVLPSLLDAVVELGART